MTDPTPLATQPAPPPQQRPTDSQDAAVLQLQLESEDLILPALTAFVTAVLAYARTGGRLAGLPGTVAKKVGYDALVITALTTIAQRALDHQRNWVGPRQAEELWEHADTGVQAGVDGGLETLKRAAQHIAAKARYDEATGGSPGISLPGEPYDPHAAEHAAAYADPKKLQLAVVQSVHHNAQSAAAAAAGWQYKVWHDRNDNRVRPAHAFLGSRKYEFHRVKIDQPFTDINGNTLWYPGDTSAPPEAWMRCRCWLSFERGTNAGALPLAASG